MLAITFGDPAGIGVEVTAAALRNYRGREPVTLVACEQMAREHGLAHLKIINVPLRQKIIPGRPTIAGSEQARDCLTTAAQMCLASSHTEPTALLTGPVSKAQLYAVGFNYPGQTEYLSALTGRAGCMMLASGTFRTVPVTIHVPLRDVPEILTIELLQSKAQQTVAALQNDFGIQAPRLACAALNPHAGENGELGREEIEVLQPACAILRKKGINITDPQPADTLFHKAARSTYDAVLCMYHDQALIPLKTLFFNSGVNITLGLPFFRTSPDHGTAFAIAGQGVAATGPTEAALRTATAWLRAYRRILL